ncbi:hypothetical protein PM3016_3853 [Paenibacillus mucilaginosus 3016]|uniref:Uncharacterized protein n=1 Tax=Paenibacillus mucilaginosus 3016 TaxID=1116391 RepID=H6NDF1_9BACL|nr:hypothetical protein PM3016_3853 [Paenibacillus mucilaginosus 3016]
MGNRTHFDRGQDGFAKISPVEYGLERPHRLVIPHVRIDGDFDAGALTKLDDFMSVPGVHRQRLLAQNALDVVLLHSPPDHLQLAVRWNGNIENLNPRITDQFLPCPVYYRDLPQLRSRLRIVEGS